MEFVASPVQIDSLDAFRYATSQCGAEISFVSSAATVSRFCCNPFENSSSCSHNVSVTQIKTMNQQSEQTTTSSSLSDSCSELTCPYFMCDSDCLFARISASDDGKHEQQFSNPQVHYCFSVLG